jgi:hypothetical protein
MVQPQANAIFQSWLVRDAKGWTVAAVGLAGLAALQFGSMAVLWFLPYHTSGLINEIGLVALGAAMGLAAHWLLRRRRSSWPPGRAALSIAAACYALASMTGLGWSASGPGFGAYRYALFSTADCDFTARFDKPPQLGRLRGDNFEVARPSVAGTANLAILADLHDFSSYRAECQGGAGAVLSGEAVQAVSQLWAQKAEVKIARQATSRDARGEIVSLEGEIAGSILSDTPGGKNSTLVALRTYIGPRSIMTVYVFQPLGSSLSAHSEAFLDGVRRR